MRERWKNIVGADGSEYSKKALAEAIKIAKKFSAEVTVVNVYHEPTSHELSQRIPEKAKVILENGEVKHKLVSVLNPNTPKVITDMAEDEKSDLVVVGSRGIGAIHAYLIGSVCKKICYDSSVSVLVVK